VLQALLAPPLESLSHLHSSVAVPVRWVNAASHGCLGEVVSGFPRMESADALAALLPIPL